MEKDIIFAMRREKKVDVELMGFHGDFNGGRRRVGREDDNGGERI